MGKNICGAQSSRNIRSIAAAGSEVLGEWPEAEVTVDQSFSRRCSVDDCRVVFFFFFCFFPKGVNRSEVAAADVRC